MLVLSTIPSGLSVPDYNNFINRDGWGKRLHNRITANTSAISYDSMLHIPPTKYNLLAATQEQYIKKASKLLNKSNTLKKPVS